MELIVTEKDNAARRIADILSDGSSSTDRRNGVNVYGWGGRRVVGLSGHVVGVDFPEEYGDWRDVRPVELVDAEVVKRPTQGNIVAALRSLAREADRVTIATDYDREGELIGKEAFELVREETDVPIDRVRFSSITDREVTEAFADPDELDFDLAAAGEARQIVDLMWGASLTRFLSLSARQLGNDFISVGRVQSPTLKLIVDREREIEAFDPEAYWELYATLAEGEDAFEAQYFFLDEDENEQERVWNEPDAEAAHEALREAATATVTDVDERTRTDDPPAPFNTTQFIRAASSIGFSAQRAMSIAEELYTAGFITYPRTDNTVYPEDLDERELLETLAEHPNFGDDARTVLEQEDITPTSGEKETTDHPPIHPTGEFPDELEDAEWRVYELVVRRFYATCSPPATWAHLRVVSEANGQRLKANGKRLLAPGYHAVYPYSSTSENYVPAVETGDELPVSDVHLDAKETQPPRRYGQSRLIETMERMGIGTKCLTADTLVLVDRDGDVERLAVGDLFETSRVVMADGDTDVAVAEDAPRTVSFDETRGSIEERDSSLVSRRSLEPDEEVFRVRTTAGSFSATGDHPVYRATDDGFERTTVDRLAPTDSLLAARHGPTTGDLAVDESALTWAEFVADADISTRLYGTGCNDAIREHRARRGLTQEELAGEIGTHRTQLSHYENHDKDVPLWVLRETGLRPEGLHGLNQDVVVPDPFPVAWTPELARLLANVLGDGSVRVDEAQNVVDIRYHNTDRRLIDRFCDDVEAVFGVRPEPSSRPGREAHHRRKYQVQLPSAIGRILLAVFDAATDEGSPEVPTPLVPAFVGALFDDEGHVSSERKAFVSNTDHELLRGVAVMLDDHGIEAALDANQHKLHVRGRQQLERFFDTVPIAADEKFYRGLRGLRRYDVTTRKATLLAAIHEEPLTTFELAERLGVSPSVVRSTVGELRGEGYVRTLVEGSNRSTDGNRVIRYAATNYLESVYAIINGEPTTARVRSVEPRAYDGPVYDLTVDETAPNFAVEGGIIVHNSTRHNTLQKLYDRGYIENDPPQPTRLAMGVVEAAEEFAEHIIDEAMTAQLEADMTAIAEGRATLDDVTEASREMLREVFEELHASREAIGEHLRESMKQDKLLGPCPESDHELLIRRSRRGSYFVGCDGFPDCRYTLPLPSNGDPVVIDETCPDHDLRHVKLLAGRDTYVHGCPLCRAEAADETPDEVIGACPECGSDHGGELAIKTLRSGSRLVGCTRYPDCEYSLPLPRRGDIVVTDETCADHDLPHVEVHTDGDDPWELGCPICNYEEYRARNAVDDLEDLDGVGAKTKEKLVEAGIATLDDLLAAEADDVAGAVQGVSADRIREWQTQAGAA